MHKYPNMKYNLKYCKWRNREYLSKTKPTVEEEQLWRISIDSFPNSHGSDAGVIIINFDREKSYY